MNIKFYIVFAACCLSQLAQAQAISNSFEEATGANIYIGGLSTINWVDGNSYGIMNNAGPEAFLSAVGTDYLGLGLTKDLGGTIQDSIYDVSFYVGKYYGSGITFADFSVLRIGGPNGTMQWNQTPEPTVDGIWYQWTGTYTPDISDLGLPFTFSVVFDLYAVHSIAIDGPVMASAAISTSASSNIRENSFEVFPNPSGDILNVRYHLNENENTTFVLADATGRNILEKGMEGNDGTLTLDLRNFNPGIYFYRVTEGGNLLAKNKLLVVR